MKISLENRQQLYYKEEKKKLLFPEDGAYAINGYGFKKDDKYWYPVMGEFHFSRFHREFWKEEICKMQAGGIQVLATYVFWIHHEEKEGEWDFSGQRCLRAFLETCKECQMPVVLRIGPWAHGECRNGGFPDWLIKKEEEGILLRSDDERYLSYARKFWKKIWEQADGMMYGQGGPVVGIQLENEYGHCGGLTGEAGMQHMHTLKKMAVALGFRVPFYTATGWGGGQVPQEECVPVLAAYCDAPWDQRLEPLETNANYVFSHYKNDQNVGSDLKVGEETGFTYDTEKMPFFTAELGGGLQVTAHRRPVVTAKDTAAMAFSKLGSGANLLGYYMYHGGTNPTGKYSTYQESKATGYLNDLPVRSYDFQAPIAEYGYLNDSFYALKPLHLFVKEFGSDMLEWDAVLPEENSENPDDENGLRISFRHDFLTHKGIFFYQRYQKNHPMTDRIEQFEICDGNNQLVLPEMVMDSGSFGWYPYAMDESEGFKLTDAFTLTKTNLSPLCALGQDVVFFGEKKPDITWEGSGQAIVISSKEAAHAYKWKEQLFTADGCLLKEDEQLYLLTQKTENLVKIYPDKIEKTVSCPAAEASIHCQEVAANDKYIDYILNISHDQLHCHDLWISIDFSGDRGEFWIGNKSGDVEQPDGDWFFTGRKWPISSKYFGWPKELYIRIYRRKTASEVYYEIEPKGEDGIHSITSNAEYKLKID